MAEVSRTKSAFWGTISTQAYTIIAMVISIFSTPMIVHYLSKDEYGLSIIIFQVINYLSLFDFGLSSAVVRNLALHRAEDENNRLMVNKIMSTGVIVALGFALIVTLMGLCLGPLLPRAYHLEPGLAAPAVPIVITLSLLVGGQFVQRGLVGIFFSNHRQALIATANFVVNTLTTLLTIGLLWRGVGLWAFVYANVFQLVITTVMLLIMMQLYYPHVSIRPRFYDRQLTSSMLNYGFFMFLQGLALQVILYTDRLVIGKVLSLELVAIFSLTVRIPEVGMSLLTRIIENTVPSVAEIVVHEGPARSRLYYHRMVVLINTLSMTAFWAMLALDEWFIRMWVGADFFAGQLILILALIIMVQMTATGTGRAFLNAKGITKELSHVTIAEAVLNLILSIGLGYRLGMPGILLGTILASLLTSTWYVPFLMNKHFGISMSDLLVRPVLWPILGTSMVGIVVFYAIKQVDKLPQFNHWAMLLLVGAVVGGVLGSFAWFVYLRQILGEYVPPRFRRYLLVSAYPNVRSFR